ncbi:hypothetical protein T07_2092 [Trichinella nelsoni]|uniref:Uncharacterized protein n=2 Tax=Trichinella nelsoni TaxID=6336 RepID=A0A0V0S5Q5_9BILA|nr:hypothetical protein T07_2092 [Trichinella nelsoni]
MVHHNFRLDTKEANLNRVVVKIDVKIVDIKYLQLDGVLQKQNGRRFQRKPDKHHHLYSIWPNHRAALLYKYSLLKGDLISYCVVLLGYYGASLQQLRCDC